MSRDSGSLEPRTGRRGSTIFDLVFVAVLGVGALSGFSSLFSGVGYLMIGSFGLLIGLAVATLSAVRSWRWSTTGLVAVGVLVVASGPALMNTALWGVIPTPDTLGALWSGAVDGWLTLLTAVPRTGSNSVLVVVPYLCGWLAGLLATAAALRTSRVVLPLLPLVGLLGVTAALGTEEPGSLLPQGAAFVIVSLGWVALRDSRVRLLAGSRQSSRRTATGVGILVAAAGAAALLVPVSGWGGDGLDRTNLRDRFLPDFDPHQYASPLNGFRSHRTESGKERELLRIRGLPEDVLVRLAAMDAYDGQVWRVAGGVGRSAPTGTGVFERFGGQMQPDPVPGAAERHRAEVDIQRLAGVWVPIAAGSESLEFSRETDQERVDNLRYNRTTGTVALTTGMRSGDAYGMDVSVAAAPASKHLRSATQDVSVSLPEIPVMPEQVQTFAADVTSGADTDHQRVAAIEEALRDGYYSDGDRRGLTVAPGHGAGRMAAFLADPRPLPDGNRPINGNAEQYASAMALMARSIGLPARVVMGFRTDGDDQVVGADVTAWVEVAFADHGWLPFFPTPDVDKTLPASPPKSKPAPRPAAQPLPPPPPRKPEVASSRRDESAEPDEEESRAWWMPSRAVMMTTGSVLGVLLVLGGCAGLILAAKARRRRRRRSRGQPHDRVAGGWNEVTDMALDMRRAVEPHWTRSEAAAALSIPQVTVLASDVDAAVFGPERVCDADVERIWDEVAASQQELEAELSRWQRLRSRLSLVSLFRFRRH